MVAHDDDNADEVYFLQEHKVASTGISFHFISSSILLWGGVG